MNDETVTFIHDLFARCAREPQPSFLTLTAIHPDGVRPTPSRHVALGDTAVLKRALSRLDKANARGWGAYYGVAPRQRDLGRWARGGKNDLVPKTEYAITRSWEGKSTGRMAGTSTRWSNP